MSRHDTIEFCGEIKWETDNAYLVFDGDNEIWIPKSQVKEKRRIGRDGDYEFTIPEWLAKEKGII